MSSQAGSTAGAAVPVTRADTSCAVASTRATATTMSYVVSGSSARTAACSRSKPASSLGSSP
jgi:hypothetical protein